MLEFSPLEIGIHILNVLILFFQRTASRGCSIVCDVFGGYYSLDSLLAADVYPGTSFRHYLCMARIADVHFYLLFIRLDQIPIRNLTEYESMI